MELDQTLKRTEDLGLLAVVRGESRGAAVEVSEALVEGGVLGIEITFTIPEAPRVIRDLDEEYGDLILLGVELRVREVSGGGAEGVSVGMARNEWGIRESCHIPEASLI